MSDIFDFGFTAVDEDELQAVQQAEAQIEQVTGDVGAVQDRLDKLFNAITPLINNLKANPEKEYIYWPGRLTKVEQFEGILQNIYKGTA